MLQAFGNGTLFGERTGDGPVQVLWLHGWGRSHRDFSAAATALATHGIASVALDFPGFGASPLPTVAGGARHYAELLQPALAELTDQPLLLVGHSFGGRVAAVLAATQGVSLRGVVFTGAPLVKREGGRRSPWRYRLLRSAHRAGLVPAAAMESARQRYGSVDYRNADGILRDVLVATVNESYEPELARITVPTALVWGAQDHDVPLTSATRAAALLSTTPDVTVVADCGHLVPTSHPQALVDAVLGMLR